MNVFRLPFRWERLQQTLMGELDAEELGSIEEFVEHATNAGADVILDPHNYARYGEHVIGSAEVSNEAFADFWRRLATKFANNDAVIFGLVNEPSELGPNGTENWLVSANLAIAAIREAGAQNLVLVPGNGWSGGASWYDDYYGTPNAEIMGGVVDPADNFAFEIHQYLDENSSGSGDECVSRSIGSERLDEVTRWAADGGHQLFLGEFGAPATETCFFAIDDLLKYLGENDDVWLGWAWWAAGPWWGDYPLSIEPEGGDHPQMDLLERHLSPE
jgi:endoglucanase